MPSKWQRCAAWARSGEPILPIGIDASTCIIITENDIDGFIINQYDIDQNTWLHINKQVLNKLIWKYTHSIAVDVKQQKIWALDIYERLAEIPMRDEDISIVNDAINFENFVDLIIIDSKLHAMKYDDKRITHLKWNADINSFYEVSKSSIIDILIHSLWKLIHYDPHTNVIQIFSYSGTQNQHGFSHCFLVFECPVADIVSWNHYSVELPDEMQEVENASIAINNQGILLYESSGTIWIYCIKSKTIKKSEITIQIKFPFLVITIDMMNYKNKNKYIVSGYVRNTWKILNIEERLFPCDGILKLISTYHLYEFVHAMNQIEHQKIRTIDILSAVQ